MYTMYVLANALILNRIGYELARLAILLLISKLLNSYVEPHIYSLHIITLPHKLFLSSYNLPNPIS